MFEVGKRYEIKTLQLDRNGYDTITQWSVVTRIDANLIELNGSEVINTTSPMFHSATDVEAAKAAAEAFQGQIVNFVFEEDDAENDRRGEDRNPNTGY